MNSPVMNITKTEIIFNSFGSECPVCIVCGYTDLRRGIDALAETVRTQYDLNPRENMMFLFCGRKQNRIKALYWEGDGFLLIYKRLEESNFHWPMNRHEAQGLSRDHYRWLVAGLGMK